MPVSPQLYTSDGKIYKKEDPRLVSRRVVHVYTTLSHTITSILNLSTIFQPALLEPIISGAIPPFEIYHP